jgi:hypothetical protein
MRNEALLVIIPLAVMILMINVDYAFASNNDKTDKGTNKEVKRDNIEDNDCRTEIECAVPSLEQLNNQDNQCKGNAKCNNESFSNIVLCKDRALCLFQYEGPFKLLNPY